MRKWEHSLGTHLVAGPGVHFEVKRHVKDVSDGSLYYALEMKGGYPGSGLCELEPKERVEADYKTKKEHDEDSGKPFLGTDVEPNTPTVHRDDLPDDFDL